MTGAESAKSGFDPAEVAHATSKAPASIAHLPWHLRAIRLSPDEVEFLKRVGRINDPHWKPGERMSRPDVLPLREVVQAAYSGFPNLDPSLAVRAYDRSIAGTYLVVDVFVGPEQPKSICLTTKVPRFGRWPPTILHVAGLRDEAPAHDVASTTAATPVARVATTAGAWRRRLALLWRPIRFEIYRRVRVLAEWPAMVGAAKALRRVARVLRLPVPAEPVPKSMILYSSSWPLNFPSPSSYWSPRHSRWLRENL
jgi:hypothetical protein